jgi:tetratricopeptide (TPR) repeat protein
MPRFSFEHSVAIQLYLAREFDQSIEQCRKTVELDPNFPIAYSVFATDYAGKGMFPEALQAAEKYASLSRSGAQALGVLGYVQARLGKRAEAQHTLEQLTAASKQGYAPAYLFRADLCWLGRPRSSIRGSQQSVRRKVRAARVPAPGGALGHASG